MGLLIVLFMSYGVFALERTSFKVFSEFSPIAAKNWCSEQAYGNWQVVMIQTHEINKKNFYLFQCTYEVKKIRLSKNK